MRTPVLKFVLFIGENQEAGNIKPPRPDTMLRYRDTPPY